MTTEWKTLPTMGDVAKANYDGWEIEWSTFGTSWQAWSGEVWSKLTTYRGRPRQPKVKKAKTLCFFSAAGTRYDILENSDHHKTLAETNGWLHVPSEDKEIEILDDN